MATATLRYRGRLVRQEIMVTRASSAPRMAVSVIEFEFELAEAEKE